MLTALSRKAGGVGDGQVPMFLRVLVLASAMSEVMMAVPPTCEVGMKIVSQLWET